MRSWVMLVPCLVVGVACGPSWPRASFGPQNQCGQLRINDHVVKAELVSVGSPLQLKVSLWPDEPPYWHTPMTMRVSDRFRGDATGDVTVYTPYPVEGSIWGLALNRPDGTAYPTWSFLRFIDGHFWLGGADLGVLHDDGRLVFANGEYASERAFLDALATTSTQPDCAMSLPDRLDGK